MLYKDSEKKKAYHRSYYEVNREKMLASDKAYYEANKESLGVKQKAYYKINREKIKVRKKTYYEDNREELLARQLTYDKTSGAQMKVARNARRRALKMQATLPTTDNELIKNLYEQRAVMTEEYGEQYHVDHIIPLNIGGAHHQDNLRIITAKENHEKMGKYHPELGGVWADNDLAREYKKKHNIE